MFTKAFAVCGFTLLLTLSSAVAQVPSDATGTQAATSANDIVSPRQHAPRRVAGFRPDRVRGNVTISDSTNWSGYAVTGSSFTYAKGSWVVPTVNCKTTPSTYAAFWVGIDGWNSTSVEQTGTDSDCSGKNPSYYAWYEFYPNPSYEITSVTVSPGNKMYAEVSYSGSEFTITIKNETTGKSYSKSSKVSGAARSSAEWIAEAPCCTGSGGILPLADFGTVDFGDDYTSVADTNWASDSSVTGPISDFGSTVNEAIMVNGSTGADEAVPSGLSTDGSSFTVKWDSE